jgi:hypothetical protein
MAAFIAGAISLVALTLNKEQKISELRQAWIDGLRNDLSTLFATVRAFARATQEASHSAEKTNVESAIKFSDEHVSKFRYQVAETRYRIQLRLNPKEKDHIELLRLIKVAIHKQQEAIDGENETDQVMREIESAVEHSTKVLKSEWERVKKGEPQFRVVNWVITLLLISAVIVFIEALLGQPQQANAETKQITSETSKPVTRPDSPAQKQ